MKILAFAGSNSDNSINRQLVEYTTTLFQNAEIEFLDLNDYEMPIYKEQRQTENGIPQQAQQFAEKVDTADLVIMSLAEHNGSYTVAFKNIFDWISRIPSRTAWNNTPLFVMATSPGGRGGAGVLQAATQSFPHYGGNVVESFSLPFFGEKFDSENRKISDTEKDNELKEKVKKILAEI